MGMPGMLPPAQRSLAVLGATEAHAQGKTVLCHKPHILRQRSASRWSSLHTRLDGHPEEMACFIRQKIYTRHRDGRAWNEGLLEKY